MRRPNPAAGLCTIVQNCAPDQLFLRPSLHPARHLVLSAMPTLAPLGSRPPVGASARVGMPDVPTRAKPCQSAPNHANARHPDQSCKTNPPRHSPPPVPGVTNFQTNPPFLSHPSLHPCASVFICGPFSPPPRRCKTNPDPPPRPRTSLASSRLLPNPLPSPKARLYVITPPARRTIAPRQCVTRNHDISPPLRSPAP
jgi:hypothetical protein